MSGAVVLPLESCSFSTCCLPFYPPYLLARNTAVLNMTGPSCLVFDALVLYHVYDCTFLEHARGQRIMRGQLTESAKCFSIVVEQCLLRGVMIVGNFIS